MTNKKINDWLSNFMSENRLVFNNEPAKKYDDQPKKRQISLSGKDARSLPENAPKTVEDARKQARQLMANGLMPQEEIDKILGPQKPEDLRDRQQITSQGISTVLEENPVEETDEVYTELNGIPLLAQKIAEVLKQSKGGRFLNIEAVKSINQILKEAFEEKKYVTKEDLYNNPNALNDEINAQSTKNEPIDKTLIDRVVESIKTAYKPSVTTEQAKTKLMDAKIVSQKPTLLEISNHICDYIINNIEHDIDPLDENFEEVAKFAIQFTEANEDILKNKELQQKLQNDYKSLHRKLVNGIKNIKNITASPDKLADHALSLIGLKKPEEFLNIPKGGIDKSEQLKKFYSELERYIKHTEHQNLTAQKLSDDIITYIGLTFGSKQNIINYGNTVDILNKIIETINKFGNQSEKVKTRTKQVITSQFRQWYGESSDPTLWDNLGSYY